VFFTCCLFVGAVERTNDVKRPVRNWMDRQ
jgi:hypothetical protein